MKNILATVLAGLVAASAALAFPVHTNLLTAIDHGTYADGTYRDFNWQWNSEDDQYLGFALDPAILTTSQYWWFRVCQKKSGGASLTLSAQFGNSGSMTCARTNLPSEGDTAYYAEVYITETATNTYGQGHTLAQGRLTVTRSLFSATNLPAFTNHTGELPGYVYVSPNWISPPWLVTNPAEVVTNMIGTDGVTASRTGQQFWVGLSSTGNWSGTFNSNAASFYQDFANQTNATNWTGTFLLHPFGWFVDATNLTNTASANWDGTFGSNAPSYYRDANNLTNSVAANWDGTFGSNGPNYYRDFGNLTNFTYVTSGVNSVTGSAYVVITTNVHDMIVGVTGLWDTIAQTNFSNNVYAAFLSLASTNAYGSTQFNMATFLEKTATNAYGSTQFNMTTFLDRATNADTLANANTNIYEAGDNITLTVTGRTVNIAGSAGGGVETQKVYGGAQIGVVTANNSFTVSYTGAVGGASVLGSADIEVTTNGTEYTVTYVGSGGGVETQKVAGSPYIVVVTADNSFTVSQTGLVDYISYYETNASITARIEALESGGVGISAETQTVAGAAYIVVTTADNDFAVSTTGLVDYISYYETNASVTVRIQALESVTVNTNIYVAGANITFTTNAGDGVVTVAGSAGGSGSQTPITAIVDYATFDMTNIDDIIFTDGDAGLREGTPGNLELTGKTLALRGTNLAGIAISGSGRIEFETNVDMSTHTISNAFFEGDGSGLTNLPASPGGGVTNLVPGNGIQIVTNSPTDFTISSASSGGTNLSVTVYAQATAITNTTLYGVTMNTNFLTVVGDWCGPNMPNQLANIHIVSADTTQFMWRIMDSSGLSSTNPWTAKFLVSQNGVQGGITNYTVPWYRNPTLFKATDLLQPRTNSGAGSVVLSDATLEIGGQWVGRGLSCSYTSAVQDGVIATMFAPDAQAAAWTTNGITLRYWGHGSTNDNKFDARLWNSTNGTLITSWSNVALVATGVVESLYMKTTNWSDTTVLDSYKFEIVQYLFSSNSVSNNAIYFIDAKGSFATP